MHGSRLRRGFTLLEMLLATLVSALLMGALYVALDVQLRHAQSGRDVIEQGTLAHSLVARMASDIKKSVTAVAPIQPPPLFTQLANNTTPAAGSTTAAPPAGTGSSAANTGPANSPTGVAAATAGPAAASFPPARDTIQFQLGLKGDSNTLTVYLSRLPYVNERDAIPGQILSDLRLVSYWLASDGSSPLGLMRREFKQVTSDEANGVGADATAGTIIAPEVQSLQFRYFDGTSWLDSWDGTQPGLDGLTPIGPPAAIEITLGIAIPSSDNRSWVQPVIHYYRHVVPILTADGVAR